MATRVYGHEYSSPKIRLRIRHHRYPNLIQWKVLEIAAALPLLLQLSLALFFLGLCYFTAGVYDSIRNTSIPLVVGWPFCFISTILLHVFFPGCLCRTSILKKASWIRHVRMVSFLIFSLGAIQAFSPRTISTTSFVLMLYSVRAVPHCAFDSLYSAVRPYWHYSTWVRLFQLSCDRLLEWCRRLDSKHTLCDENEIARGHGFRDREILLATDAPLVDDGLIDTLAMLIHTTANSDMTNPDHSNMPFRMLRSLPWSRSSNYAT